MSQLKTRLSSRAQLMRTGLRCAQAGSGAVCPGTLASSSDPVGTTIARSFASFVKDGASTPWNRMAWRERVIGLRRAV